METALHPITLYWTASKNEEGTYFSHLGNKVFTVAKNQNYGNPKWDAFVQDSVHGPKTRVYNDSDKLFATMKDSRAACTKYAEKLRSDTL